MRAEISIQLFKDKAIAYVSFDNMSYRMIMSPYSCLILNSVINALSQQCTITGGERFFLPDVIHPEDIPSGNNPAKSAESAGFVPLEPENETKETSKKNKKKGKQDNQS